MQNETSDTGVFLIIFTAIAFIILKNFLLSVFITIWKWPMMAFLFPLVYIPTEITNGFLFFWVDANIKDTAINYINILSLDSIVIVEKYEDKDVVTTVNIFFSTLTSPYLIFLFGIFSYGIYKFRNNNFKRIFSMETLIQNQASLWPQIKPMVNMFPNKIDDLDEGEWAMCLEPYEFAKKNKILIESEDNIGDLVLKLDANVALSVFQKQLGRPWNGVDDLDENEKYIFAILASRACRNTKHSLNLVGQIATSFSTEAKYSKKDLKKLQKASLLEAEKAIKMYKNNEIIQDVISQHFYVNTVLARLLETSRTDGVLASADFLWLKIRNRRLWFILNNIGRRSAWTEAAGTWFHYNYEKAIRRKIPSSMVTGAISALDLSFRESSDAYVPLQNYNKELN